MLQQALNIVQVVAFLGSFTALASRLFDASRPFWSRFPAWCQTFLPAVVPALAALAQGLTGVKNWGDLSVLFVVCLAMLLPGLPSNRSAAPLQAGKVATSVPSVGDIAVASALNSGTIKPKAPSVPPVVGLMLLCFAAFVLPACGLLTAAVPYLAEAGVLIADATNAVDVAEASHLVDADLIARARATLAAAAAADDGAKDLTSEQLDASLAAFRAAWADIVQTYSAKHVGAAEGGGTLPVPLAVRRAYK